MKLTLEQLKRIIKEEMSRPQGMGTGGAPMSQNPPGDDFDLSHDDLDDDSYEDENPGFDGGLDEPLGTDEFDDGEYVPPHHWTNNEEAHDDPEDRPGFHESFKLPKLSQLDERAGMDPVATTIRNALNDCANLTSNVLQVVTRKKPEWKDAIKAIRQAEEAIDTARQSLMSHG